MPRYHTSAPDVLLIAINAASSFLANTPLQYVGARRIVRLAPSPSEEGWGEGHGKRPAGGNRPAPGNGNTAPASGASPPAAVAPASGNDLLSLAIESVVSSAPSIGNECGLGAFAGAADDVPTPFGRPTGGPSSSPATVTLGPVTVRPTLVADYVRPKDSSNTSWF
jgi:hypothetical protein